MYDINTKYSIYKWRSQNVQKYNAYMNVMSKSYYEQNKKECNQKRVKRARYQREWMRLRNILL